MSFSFDPFFGSASSSSSTAASSTLTTPIDLESTFSLGPTGLDYFEFASLGTNDGASFSPSPFDSGYIFSLPNSSLFNHIPSSFLASPNISFDFDQPPSNKAANLSSSLFPSSSSLPSSLASPQANTALLPLRGRKRSVSQSQDGSDQSTVRSPSPPRAVSGRGRKTRKVKKEDDEDDFGGSDAEGSLDGDEYAGGRGKGGVNKLKAERRKATNRASAKAFRARRKSLLSDLQVKISERDEEIENLQSLIVKLRDQKETLLSKRKQSSSSSG